jgi:hypothetical protein
MTARKPTMEAVEEEYAILLRSSVTGVTKGEKERARPSCYERSRQGRCDSDLRHPATAGKALSACRQAGNIAKRHQSAQLMAWAGQLSMACWQSQVPHFSGPITTDFSSLFTPKTCGHEASQSLHPTQRSSFTTGLAIGPSSKVI